MIPRHMAPVDSTVDLSVGVVTYNRATLLDRCLHTVAAACAEIPHEIIVVDNGSRDGTASMVRARHPQVTLLPNAHNVGLTRGVNQILEVAQGRHLMFLDDDTEIELQTVARLLAFLKAHPETGMVAPQLVYPDGTEQGAAKAFPTPMAALFGRRSLLRRWLPNNPFSRRYLISAYVHTAEPYEVDSISAACMVLRRETIAQAGGMDEDFFVYWSDVDWCRRVREQGWQICVVPTARVVHFESRKIAKQRPRAIIDFHKGAYLCYCKHSARSPWHPMRVVAVIGLALRAVLLLTANVFKAPPTPAHVRGPA